MDGRAAVSGGQYLTYREFPWGEVYLRQFTGRCINRFAFSYGGKPDLLRQVMEKLPARPLQRSDCGWEVELMPGLFVQLLLWLGDEEFPPARRSSSPIISASPSPPRTWPTRGTSCSAA